MEKAEKDYHPTEIFVLKASDSVNWGFLLFGSIAAAIGYWLTDTILSFLCAPLFLITGSFGITALLSPLFFQYRQANLYANKLEIREGRLRNRKISVNIADIKKPEVVVIENGQKNTFSLEEIDLEANTAIKIDSLSFTHIKDDRITFSAYNFDEPIFKEFVKSFKNIYQVYLGIPIKKTKSQIQATEKNIPIITEEEKQINNAMHRCESYLADDNQLLTELREAMNEAYSSAYRPHKLTVVREGDELRLQKKDVIFSYQTDEDNYCFYLKDDHQSLAGADEIAMAEKLIQTSQHNIEIAEARVKVYQGILAQLQQTKAKYLQRMKIQAIADKLSTLQQRNLQNADEKDELSFDSETIVQLEMLTEKVKKADLEHYAETLIQHAILLKNNLLEENDNSLLQDLNEKLK